MFHSGKGFVNILWAFLFILPQGGQGQSSSGPVPDAKTGKIMWVGRMKVSDLQLEAFHSWYVREHDSYQPDPKILASIDSLGLGKLKIKIIFGTWCGDTRRELPRFLKLMESLNYQRKIEMWAVDRNKQAPGISIADLDIQRVPTFIFYRKGKEIGRIVESPSLSLEKDLLKILQQVP